MSRLTELDGQYIKFIVDYYRENYFYPSYDEIATGMVCSKSTVFTHMQKLENEGVLVRKTPNSPAYRLLNMELMLKESEGKQ